MRNNRFYAKNDTLIFKFNIAEQIDYLKGYKELEGLECRCFSIEFIDDIALFYNRNGHLDIGTSESIKKMYSNGSCFHGVINSSGEIVAGMMIHTNIVDISTPSFYALKEHINDVVVLSKDTVYSSHNFVIPQYRGHHVYKALLQHVLEHYKDNYNSYFFITGKDNQKMINSALSIGGKLIGVIRTKKCFRFNPRRELFFIDTNEVCWNSISMK